ncbi:CHC2 zinc finger domain-containing protein [Microbaculum marinisediminis]|uniref:CHC2 zinc finger domain-containing protein n=1 Tax=Microbaculum marinisediminis TaxID=2931392 RepID=UPI0028F7499A|nr:CHC2 zinc finger domain-containing protein [Microbaculum sp. A6E488]
MTAKIIPFMLPSANKPEAPNVVSPGPFTVAELDAIRARMPISEIAGRKVKLRPQGREFIGLSPFNAETTPSFIVNDHDGTFRCFSSDKRGDVFELLMELEGLTFRKAVEKLAAETGLALSSLDDEEVSR